MAIVNNLSTPGLEVHILELVPSPVGRVVSGRCQMKPVESDDLL